MSVELFANNASSPLASSINSAVTSLSVTSAAAFPATGNFRILIDAELMLVTAVSSNTFTVTRAIEGTSAASHTAPVAVTHILTAAAISQTLTDVVALRKISQVSLGTTATTINFNTIPQTYTSLMITTTCRCDLGASFADDAYLQFNGDTGAHYSREFSNANGSALATGADFSSTQAGFLDVIASSGTANFPMTATIWVHNYTNTTFVKLALMQQFTPQSLATGANGVILQTNGYLWNSTAAITDILIGLKGGDNYIAGSVFTLYGLL